MGLGPVHTFSLEEARELARQCRQQIKQGINPLEARKADKRAKQKERAKTVTFKFAADEFLRYKKRTVGPGTYRNIDNAFRDYLKPAFGELAAVSDIDHLAVFSMLTPIYEQTKQHGKFVRLQIEGMMDRVKSLGWRTGDNPAALDGLLGPLVQEIERSHIGTPRAALPFREVGPFLARLRALRTQRALQRTKDDGKMNVAALALEFIILTAVRVSQVCEGDNASVPAMQWTEIDFDKRLWTCPWQRTKTGRKTQQHHVVMLSEAALAVLMLAKQMEVKSDFVFATQVDRWNGRKPRLAGAPIERHAPTHVVNYHMERSDITVHGFRVSFSSWAHENRSSWAHENNFAEDAIEISLDHEVGKKIRRLYSRDAKYIEQRHRLMEAWGEFCSRPEPLAEVLPFRQAK
jgi:integrase